MSRTAAISSGATAFFSSRLATFVLCALLDLGSTISGALAAGGAHIVDDSEVEMPGVCHLETWVTRFVPGFFTVGVTVRY